MHFIERGVHVLGNAFKISDLVCLAIILFLYFVKDDDIFVLSVAMKEIHVMLGMIAKAIMTTTTMQQSSELDNCVWF